MFFIRRFLLAAFCGVLFCGISFAQTVNTPTAPPPAGNTILLWPEGAPGAVGDTLDDKPRLEPFLLKGSGMHSAVIVAPGGSYTHLAYDKEGVKVAQWFNAHGVSAFVLTYRLTPRYLYPTPLLDGKRAIRWVRSHAAEYGVDPAKIGVLGFSAGGHLVGYLGTHFDAGDASSSDPVEQVSSRPDFVVGCYGRYTLEPGIGGSFTLDSLIGKNPSDAVRQDVASVLHVTAQTPPFFIFSTTPDTTVSSMNATSLYNALKLAGVPVELHIFDAGSHGTGLAQQYPTLKVWPLLMDAWMQEHGWMPAEQ